MEDDPVITQTTDRTFAERLMVNRHWVSDQGSHYVITAVPLMADTPGRDEPMWSIHGHLERDDEICPIGGS